MLEIGKGFFIWKISKCEGGDSEAIANEAAAAGFGHVLIKVANGIWRYNFDEQGNDLCPPVVAALKARGIKVWGWHYVFGDSPTAEADVAATRINELGLDGYVIDAEKEYKQAGKAAKAVIFFDRLDTYNIEIPVALSSYRYPSVHPEFPWTQFLPRVDLAMPQVYWIHAHNPAEQLLRTLNEYAVRAPELPVIPTGAAFKEWGWYPTVAEIKEFMFAAEEAELPAVNFWEWANCRSYLVDCWQAVADYDWEGGSSPPPEPIEPPDWENEIPDLPLVTVISGISRLRVRRGPGINYETLGYLYPDEEARVADYFYIGDPANPETDIWFVVITDGVLVGWSAYRYAGIQYLEWIGLPEPPPSTITLRAKEHFPLGIAVNHDKKCEGKNPPGKPIIEHPPMAERIIYEKGDQFEAYAKYAYSCKDSPNTPTILSAGRDLYYVAVDGYEGQVSFAKVDFVEVVP